MCSANACPVLCPLSARQTLYIAVTGRKHPCHQLWSSFSSCDRLGDCVHNARVSSHFRPGQMYWSTSLVLVLVTALAQVQAVKFQLQAAHSPTQKCLWNYAMSDTLVVISVSAPLAGSMQRLDMEVVDGSGSRNIYQSKKGLKGETRMAVTTHADADLGVCFRNVLDPCKCQPGRA